MELLGDWNWYFPSWLEWLPKISIEGERPSELGADQAPAVAGDLN
jgi:RND superfamily putative drug exporter